MIPALSFSNVITNLYEKNETNFTDIWYRWENNNLRLRWEKMLNYMTDYKLPYGEVSINLGSSVANEKVNLFLEKVSNSIQNYLDSFSDVEEEGN